jgi:soluble lytic murein transglycosylase-like protein
LPPSSQKPQVYFAALSASKDLRYTGGSRQLRASPRGNLHTAMIETSPTPAPLASAAAGPPKPRESDAASGPPNSRDAALISLARAAAAAHALDPALVCAVCEQESSWEPWAIRYEPGFMARYVAPPFSAGKIGATEAYARCFSWGLMQIMGQTARERGYTEDSLATLCDPVTGLEYGCRELANRLAAANGDVAKGLQSWNGGGNVNYASQVLARLAKYQTPLVVDPEIGT